MGTYIPLGEHRPELSLPGLFLELEKRSPRRLGYEEDALRGSPDRAMSQTG